jgi:hypothetical protein
MSKRQMLKSDSHESHSTKKGKSGFDLRVSVSDQIQFKGEYFEVTVLLLDSLGQLQTNDSNQIILKKPYLCYKNSFDECNEKIEIDNKTWNSKLVNGRLTFQAKINTLSRDASGKEFRICISSEDRSILPCYSNPMTIISYKLKLLSETPSKWYNQMGGGGNCITLEIECHDSSNKLINKSIPLNIILVYSDDGEEVRTQEILTKSEDSQMNTINGKSIMKVRIEHVSRKHQNRLFAIKIAPNIEKDPLSANVSSIISGPINVLSKITNRQPKENTQAKLNHINALNNQLRNGAGGGGGGGYDDSSHSDSSPSSSMFANSSSSSSYQNNPSLIVKTELGQSSLLNNVAPSAAPILDEDDNELSSLNGNNINTVPNHSGCTMNSNVPVVQALSNVLGWIDGTLKCLCEAKWQQAGYETNAQGEVDYNRPLFHMSNPNDKIQVQLDAYRNKVMGSLSTVLEGIEPLLNEVQQSSTASTHIDGAGQQQQNLQPDYFNNEQHDNSSSSSSSFTTINNNQCHPEPLSFGSSPCRQPDLARSGSSGIPGSAELEALANDSQYDATGDQILPLLRGLSRGFSDYNGQI